ncbi:biliverdin-producing heme oxygenase [Luteolibacter flavescens]|uniref:Biliverdin-producing heme oxygenase n=1 Tax=Luteolibacter flavescens TaxID=1859460 RepID=A0ABT3FJ74_9BACT|nr:biliverdin-producing heme oxygenase [Luteolibacter flavescens]MCW1883623.1 biliverdin-producing heme oxygenase [Luteolibacter flavescens]
MTLLQALRAATHSSHQQLDRQISGEEITSDREAYARYLERFHDGLATCWSQLDWALLADLGLPDLDARKARYHSLTADLNTLGHPVPALDGTPAPQGDAARTIGCLYVLEGSIHGGAILLAELEKNTGTVPADACRFMTGFGEQNRTRWKDFTAWLDSLEADDDFRKDAAESAVKAFENFITSFGVTSATPATP